MSRFLLARGLALRTSVFKFQQISPMTTSTVPSDNEEKKENVASKYPPEYPPPTSKRDFVNFPRPVQREYCPPVRLGFIPESWFNFFYPKTGYTGPYVFITTVGIYFFSKEIILVNDEFAHFLNFIGLMIVAKYKFSEPIAKFYNKKYEEVVESYDKEQRMEKEYVRNAINDLESQDKMKSAVIEATKATKELVNIQVELAFRERLDAVHKKVKNLLDCEVELENLERRISQKNMMDFVLSNVMKSITPELQTSTMQSCIRDLNALASNS